jgi:hypothetical protein
MKPQVHQYKLSSKKIQAQSPLVQTFGEPLMLFLVRHLGRRVRYVLWRCLRQCPIWGCATETNNGTRIRQRRVHATRREVMLYSCPAIAHASYRLLQGLLGEWSSNRLSPQCRWWGGARGKATVSSAVMCSPVQSRGSQLGVLSWMMRRM